jgi:hypothetical protein
LLIPALLIAAACGSGDNTSSTSTTTTSSAGLTLSSSPEATDSASAVDDLCPLLPKDDVFRTTGYKLLLAQFHKGPGPLHFCTIYLDIPDCQMQCAVSLEDLGPVDPKNSNTPELYREIYSSANSDGNATFEDGVAGENSWLAVAQAGELPGWKLVYFQVNGVAYDLHGPFGPKYTLTREQIIAAMQAVIANLNKSPLSS